MINRYFVATLWLVVAISILGCSERPADKPAAPAMDSLVSAEWLKEHIDDADLVVIDATVLVSMDAHGNYESTSGRSQYDEGHIPGAVFADLKGNLRDAENPLEFGMPSPEQFALVMGSLGIHDESRVVIYDNMGTVWAARVWWMLRWIGFDRAAILDGGLAAWEQSRWHAHQRSSRHCSGHTHRQFTTGSYCRSG